MDEKKDEIESCRALFIPHMAIRDNMYPDVYRLFSDITSVRTPIVPFGIGAKYVGQNKLSLKNAEFMQKLNPLPCRDNYTVFVLKNSNGLSKKNVFLSGDPAWFDFDFSKGTESNHSDIQNIAFTLPNAPYFEDQALQAARILRGQFPDAKIFVAMHHSNVSHHNYDCAKVLKENGDYDFKPLVMTETKDLEFYKSCDLHVGYRLHAHIYCLRNGIRSLLIHEDMRGKGFDETVQINGMDAFSVHDNKLHNLFSLQYLKKRGWRRNFDVKTSVSELIGLLNNIPDPKHCREIFQKTWYNNTKPFLEKVCGNSQF